MSGTDLAGRWLAKAADDLLARLFEDYVPRQIDIACYHAHQSAEKALKSFLIAQGTEPPRSHDLVVVCKMCAKINAGYMNMIDDCAILTPFSVVTRYPSEVVISEEHAAIAIQKAQSVYDFSARAIEKSIDKRPSSRRCEDRER